MLINLKNYCTKTLSILVPDIILRLVIGAFTRPTHPYIGALFPKSSLSSFVSSVSVARRNGIASWTLLVCVGYMHASLVKLRNILYRKIEYISWALLNPRNNN